MFKKENSKKYIFERNAVASLKLLFENAKNTLKRLGRLHDQNVGTFDSKI